MSVPIPSDANLPEYFEQLEGYARFQPVGEFSLSQAAKAVSHAIIYARDHAIPKLLVNGVLIKPVYKPSIIDRYFIVREWAVAARGLVIVAFVFQPETIHPQKFGVTVAFNHGLRAEVCSSEAEALEWLCQWR